MRKDIIEEIRNEVFARQDVTYQAFQAKLIPTLPKEKIIGVRIPELRKLAKNYALDPYIQAFLEDLPHAYYDEDQLHAFILAENPDFSEVLVQLEKFLPYVDNWATCDELRPKCFKKHIPEVLLQAERWIADERTYVRRFGMGMLLNYGLEEDFQPEYLSLVAEIHSEEYYVRMMQAWFFATALAKQWEAVLPILTEEKLEFWTHNRTIQKAIESYRIMPEQKKLLRTLKRKKER